MLKWLGWTKLPGQFEVFRARGKQVCRQSSHCSWKHLRPEIHCIHQDRRFWHDHIHPKANYPVWCRYGLCVDSALEWFISFSFEQCLETVIRFVEWFRTYNIRDPSVRLWTRTRHALRSTVYWLARWALRRAEQVRTPSTANLPVDRRALQLI